MPVFSELVANNQTCAEHLRSLQATDTLRSALLPKLFTRPSVLEHAEPCEGTQVSAVAIDQTSIVSADNQRSGSVIVWDRATGQQLQTLNGHTEPVHALAMDDAVIAIGTGDWTQGEVRIHSRTDGAHLRSLDIQASVISLAMHNQKVVVACHQSSSVSVWEYSSGDRLFILDANKIILSVAAVCNTAIVTGGGDGTVQLWNCQNGVLEHTLAGHLSEVKSVAAEGSIAVSSSTDKTIRVWDCKSGTPIQTDGGQEVVIHTDSTAVVAIHGTTIVSSSDYDPELSVWSLKGQLLRVLSFDTGTVDIEGNRDCINAIAVDNLSIVAGMRHSTIRLCDRSASAELLVNLEESVDSTAMHCGVVIEGDTVVVAMATHTNIWDGSTGKLEHTLKLKQPSPSDEPLNQTTIGKVLVSIHMGTVVVISTSDTTLTIWDRTTGNLRLVKDLSSVNGIVKDLSSVGGGLASMYARQQELCTLHGLAMNASVVAIACDDQTIKLLDLKSGELLQSFKGHTESVNTVAISDTVVLSGAGYRELRGRIVGQEHRRSTDNSAKLWDLATGELLFTMLGHQKRINAVVLDDSLVLSGSDDGTVIVWGRSTGDLMHTLQVDRVGAVKALALCDNFIICGTSSLMAYHRDTFEKMMLPMKISNAGVQVSQVAVCGSLVGVCWSDGSFNVFNGICDTGNVMRACKEHEPTVAMGDIFMKAEYLMLQHGHAGVAAVLEVLLSTDADNKTFFHHYVVNNPYSQGLVWTLMRLLPELAVQVDPYSQSTAYEMSAKNVMLAIDSATEFLERYRLIGHQALYRSETCEVWFAIEFGEPDREVAIKIMKERDQFRREVTIRKTMSEFPGHHSGTVIVDQVHVPASEYEVLSSQIGIKAESEYEFDFEQGGLVLPEHCEQGQYVLVMPRAERSLAEILAYERIAGRDIDMIKAYGKQIVQALAHVHSSGIFHGDVKPSNVLREQTSRELQLSDFDAAATFGEQVGLKAASSSAYIPPEDAARLVRGDSPCFLATSSYDAWMLGCTLFELFTGTKLFATAKVDSDAIEPTAMQELIDWSGLSDSQRNSVLAESTATSIHLERQNAISLLECLLAFDPADRPADMTKIAAHPFWNAAADALVNTDPQEVRRSTLGFALATLSAHMRLFCQGLSQTFLESAKGLVTSHGMTWKQAVAELAPKHRAKWEDVNGNSSRDRPAICSVCHGTFGDALWNGIEEDVEIWNGTSSGAWSNPAKILKGKIVGESRCGFKYNVRVQFPGAPSAKIAEKHKDRCRRPYREALTRSAADSSDANLQKVQTGLAGLSLDGVITQEEVNRLLALLPTAVKCNHDLTDKFSTCNGDPTSTDHYNFELRTSWDVLRLFVPYNKPPKFKESWCSQDATNLLNFIIATGGIIEQCLGGDTSFRNALQDAAIKSKAVRNEWAHQTDTNINDFESAFNELRHFSALMPLCKIDKTRNVTMMWDEVTKHVDAILSLNEIKWCEIAQKTLCVLHGQQGV